MSISRSCKKSELVDRVFCACLLGLTYLVLLAFQGLYPCVHLWPHISSWELTESPAPGRVLHGGGRAVLYWKPPRHHAGGHLQVFIQKQCPNFLLLPQLCFLPSSWDHSFSRPCMSWGGVAQAHPKIQGLVSRGGATKGIGKGRYKKEQREKQKSPLNGSQKMDKCMLLVLMKVALSSSKPSASLQWIWVVFTQWAPRYALWKLFFENYIEIKSRNNSCWCKLLTKTLVKTEIPTVS